MFETIKKYFNLIDSLLQDFLTDLKSFRVQLVYMSYVFNLIVIYAVIFKNLDWKALTVSFGTQTMIYAFFFASKKAEHSSAKDDIENIDPPTERDPDEL